MRYTILKREGDGGRYYPAHKWLQYQIIGDGVVYIVDMVQALIAGWNFGRVTVQGEAEWPGMSHDDIVAWKKRNDDGRTSVVEHDAESGFQKRLIAHAVGPRAQAA